MGSVTATIAVSLDFWTVAAAAVCGAICMRIVTFRRGGLVYKLRESLVAWAIAAAAGCYSLSVVLSLLAGRPVEMVSPYLLVILVILMVQLFRARGNVARVLQLDWGGDWSGAERRKN